MQGQPEIEWHYLGNGELIARIDEAGFGRVTEVLGTDWAWGSAEFGTLTDQDGTVTEWVTLMGCRRRHLTGTPDLETAA